MRCSIHGVLLRNISILALVLSVGVALSSATARGQNIYVANYNGTIGEYNATTGAVVNQSLVSGSGGDIGIAISGSNLFVTNRNGTISEYNATTGAVVNATLVSGLGSPWGIAVSGANLFVACGNTGTIGEYDATTGAVVNASLVSGLSSPEEVAVSGSNLFVVNWNTGTIGEYTTSGGTVNASLVGPSGLNYPWGVAVSGSDLFVTNTAASTIGEYTTSGVVVNPALVAGLTSPSGITVSGSDLFVVNNGARTIGEYTTSGAVVNASLVSGLSNPSFVVATSAPVNGFWTNGADGNWSASGNWSGGNVPGFSGYAADTAMFGASVASGTATVTLDGASPCLTALTFANSAASYTIASGTGGTLCMLGLTSSITDAAGSHAIAASLEFASLFLVRSRYHHGDRSPCDDRGSKQPGRHAHDFGPSEWRRIHQDRFGHNCTRWVKHRWRHGFVRWYCCERRYSIDQ